MPADGSKNLKNFKEYTKEERIAIATKGGQTKSDKKTRANRFKNLKHGQYSKHFTKYSVEALKDPDMFAEYLAAQLKHIEADSTTKIDKREIVKIADKLFNSIHGTKIKSQNVNINVSTTADEVVNRISAYKKKIITDEDIKEEAESEKKEEEIVEESTTN